MLALREPEPIIRLESAPRSHWAKHRARARLGVGRLLRSWLLTGRWHYALLLLSETGRLLAREKYSAFAIDRIYANTPAGLGWLGRRLDRYVLDLPVHRAVRDRFAFVTRHLRAILQAELTAGATVRVLSVPCGLARDLCTVYAGLSPALRRRVEFYGLDLDYEGRVLAETRRRTDTAGVPILLVQANALLDHTWSWLRTEAGPLSVINCIGLAPWLTPEELAALLQRFATHLRSGGHLLLDRFNRGRHSKLGADAEIHAHYHTEEIYRVAIDASGLIIADSTTLGESEGTAYWLRRP
ncbi:MAG TPA: class I SAM-dependent methyltransferase [Gemmataceae bacterium]|nr:class I SAM-dependent methyltransferase [Gemmataceae bacterium]